MVKEANIIKGSSCGVIAKTATSKKVCSNSSQAIILTFEVKPLGKV